MVSLKTKNPFASGSVELFSAKTWIGIGAFAVVAGIAYAAIALVKSSAEKMGNPVDSVWSRLGGSG